MGGCFFKFPHHAVTDTQAVVDVNIFGIHFQGQQKFRYGFLDFTQLIKMISADIQAHRIKNNRAVGTENTAWSIAFRAFSTIRLFSKEMVG